MMKSEVLPTSTVMPAAWNPIDARRLGDLEIFREAPFAPEMVVVPPGGFWMGSDSSDDEADATEKIPDGKKCRTRIADRFELGRYPVTFEEYEFFCAAKQHKIPPYQGWGRGRRPVICVSWDDAMAYVDWLNGRLGVNAYRLPSEAQWEYACRGGTNTRRWWRDEWDAKMADGDGSFEGGRTSPVDDPRYSANPWGLRDMIGNVW